MCEPAYILRRILCALRRSVDTAAGDRAKPRRVDGHQLACLHCKEAALMLPLGPQDDLTDASANFDPRSPLRGVVLVLHIPGRHEEHLRRNLAKMKQLLPNQQCLLRSGNVANPGHPHAVVRAHMREKWVPHQGWRVHLTPHLEPQVLRQVAEDCDVALPHTRFGHLVVLPDEGMDAISKLHRELVLRDVTPDVFLLPALLLPKGAQMSHGAGDGADEARKHHQCQQDDGYGIDTLYRIARHNLHRSRGELR
mmetsp:Transcript_37173/g.93216  ORF Transcript_37173/g.93216 Transcript_37173/m.93216 type:complete len:252 (-) Transcript_37173:1128-1883(-)